MEMCGICEEEVRQEFIREDEEGKFCLFCGIEEGILDLELKSITDMLENIGIVDNRDPLFDATLWEDELEIYVNTREYVKNMFTTSLKTQAMQMVMDELDYRYYRDEVEEVAELFGYNVISRNTYNFNCVLDTTLQYYILHKEDDWVYDSDALIAIQFHHGGDARTNYSPPIFLKPNDLEYFIMGLKDIAIIDKNGNIWDSYDVGYKWENTNSENEGTDEFIQHLAKDKNGNLYWKWEFNKVSFQNVGITGY